VNRHKLEKEDANFHVDPGLFMVGGAVGQARFMPRFVALQIKARTLGTPLPIYNGERRAMPVLD
jgi:hypothetical protein